MAVTLLIVLTGTAYTFILPKKYASAVRILVREDTMDVDVFDRQMSPGYNPFFLRTQERLIKSNPVLYQVIDNLNLQKIWGEKLNEDKGPVSREIALQILQSSVHVEQDRDTSIIIINVTREDPEEAAQIANEIASVYPEHRLGQRRHEIRRAIDVLDNEVQKQQEQVDKAEADLEKAKKLGATAEQIKEAEKW